MKQDKTKTNPKPNLKINYGVISITHCRPGLQAQFEPSVLPVNGHLHDVVEPQSAPSGKQTRTEYVEAHLGPWLSYHSGWTAQPVVCSPVTM